MDGWMVNKWAVPQDKDPLTLPSKDDNKVSVLMAAPAQLKTHTHLQTQTHRSKRRKRRDTTTTTTVPAAAAPPHVVSTDGAWCCSASKSHSSSPRRATAAAPPPPPPRPPPPPPPPPPPRFWASPAMDTSPAPPYTGYAPYPSSYSKFNTALNAGLLNPMSPPPPLDKTRSSPTLFDMMANEQDYHPRPQASTPPPPPPAVTQDRQLVLQERVALLLGNRSPGNQFNDPETSDVRLTLSSKDGLSISMNVHRHILVTHSRFFAGKLSDRWSKQQRSLPHLVEISDCDDVEVYVETLRLMYSKDIRRRLMKEDVPKILGILKVSSAIGFDAGVLSCLEYLEAAPWAEEEEEKVASLLAQLHLESSGAGEVLKRVSLELAPSSMEDGSSNGGGGEEILVRLLQVVLEGKDEKARREMKGLVSKMLRENNNGGGGGGGVVGQCSGDLSKGSLYSACDGCLRLLRHHFFQAAAGEFSEVAQIARQADNLHWLLDILIDRQIAEEFLRTWAGEVELSEVHGRVPAVHRYEISRVTARLFVGIGKGQVLVTKEVRCMLLRTWLEPFYEDFAWMRRACKGLDRHLVEDGLGNTILTLPLAMQQEILLAWFDRFLNSGDDCPNIQRGFEVWWRRAFWRRNVEVDRSALLRIAAVSDTS